AAQHLSFSKPWLRIIVVGVGGKSGKRCEVRGRPFPNITDHLPAAECAVATRASRNIERTVERKVEICMIARRQHLAPGPNSFGLRETPSSGARFADPCRLPLGFCRQPALCPAAPGSGFVPVYKHDGGIQLQILRSVVAPPPPHAVRFWLPVNGTLGALVLTPGPAGIAPKFPNAIATCLNERRKLPIGDRGARDPEWFELDWVRPLLVIENETIGLCSAKSPRAARHFGIARQGAGRRRRAFAQSGRRRIGQRFPHVSQRFDVHVLVADGQFVEIGRMNWKIVAREMLAL